MIVSRKNLLAKLRTIKPALAASDRIPALTHFLFDGKRIVAFNDAIVMSVPQQSDFKGLVPPSLLDLLAASSARVVEINAANGKAQVMLDGAVVTLPVRPVEDFLFRMPSESPAHLVPAAFLQGVEHCLKSISSGATVPEHLGVTLIPVKHGLSLFGTSEATISYTCLTLSPFKLKERVTLPADFCRQMLVLASSAKTWRFDIYRNYALFAADDVLLFSKLILSEYPLDFVGVVQRHVPKTFASRAIPLPKQLRGLLKRSATVNTSRATTIINVEGGTATLTTQNNDVVITEYLNMPRHPDIRVKVRTSLLYALSTWAERLLLTTNAIIMNSGPHFYLCTASRD